MLKTNSIVLYLRGVAPDVRQRLIFVYGILAVLNFGAWIWAWLAFRNQPALLSIAAVVYGLGLRHAVDADHIAAIDNVTRKLMQANQRPVAVGFFFALGHSTVVFLVAAAVSGAATMLNSFKTVQVFGGAIDTSISAFFLFAIAAMNIAIFLSLWQCYQRVRAGRSYVEQDFDILLNSRGLLARIFRPVFRFVTKSWHMFPLGFLFGLGFDTATEVAVFGVSAAQAAKGVSIFDILVFPTLFAAGMSLLDTTDGVMMLGAYEWAFIKPMRKLYYNMTITLASIGVALLVGGIEALGLMANAFSLSGKFWGWIARLNQNFSNLGFMIIAVFSIAWLISYAIYRSKSVDDAVAPTGVAT